MLNFIITCAYVLNADCESQKPCNYNAYTQLAHCNPINNACKKNRRFLVQLGCKLIVNRNNILEYCLKFIL